MLSVSFAFVVATALCLAFEKTRAIGAVGLFVLICIDPLFVLGLAALVAIGYYLVFVKKKCRALRDMLGRRD